MNRTNLIEDLTLLPLPPWWQNPWILLALVAGAAVVLGLGFWLARRFRPTSRPPAPAPAPVVPPDDFLRRLQELRRRQPRPPAYPLAIEASEILREYIEARFRFRILYQTTREFLGEAASRPELSEPQRGALGEFLAFCDDVKFAQAPATEAEQERLLDTAERVIRETAGLGGGNA